MSALEHSDSPLWVGRRQLMTRSQHLDLDNFRPLRKLPRSAAFAIQEPYPRGGFFIVLCDDGSQTVVIKPCHYSGLHAHT